MGKTKEERHAIGQFFTGKPLADYMSSLYTPKEKHLMVIDAGAGSGILSKAFVEEWGSKTKIHLIAYENDSKIIPTLQGTLKQLSARFPDFEYEIREENYITAEVPLADFIISNPPYLKIGTTSMERIALMKACPVTNLYAAFMVKSVLGLKKGGEMVYLVPRSWTAGFYFSAFRAFLQKNGAIMHLTIFEDRRDIFSGEDVLQDVVIFRFKKGESQESIRLCCVERAEEETRNTISIPNQLLYWGKNKSLILPTTEEEKQSILRITKVNKSFSDMGREIKTGTVVQFRSVSRISKEQQQGMIPLLTSDYVFRRNTEGLLFIDPQDSEKMKNQWYVILSRIVPKENKGKIQVSIYDPIEFNSEWIALDLNLCYVPCNTKKDAEVVARYFQNGDFICFHRAIQSGNQISVRTIMELPWIDSAS